MMRLLAVALILAPSAAFAYSYTDAASTQPTTSSVAGTALAQAQSDTNAQQSGSSPFRTNPPSSNNSQ
jgi:hypothetical protein